MITSSLPMTNLLRRYRSYWRWRTNGSKPKAPRMGLPEQLAVGRAEAEDSLRGEGR